MTAKEHYDKHLAKIYAWMCGDFESRVRGFRDFLVTHQLTPTSNNIAIDLGAGHGIQSVALAEHGFIVKAIDFNHQLLAELKSRAGALPIETVCDDIRAITRYQPLQPALIVCAGDTLTHLESKSDIAYFVEECCMALAPGGRFVLSFRDYSAELSGDQRFIAVKSDESRILTCVLDYEPERVRVTDLLHEKTTAGWKQNLSAYYKTRIAPAEVAELLTENGMQLLFHEPIQGMHTFIASKEGFL